MISVDCKQHSELSVVSSVMIDYFTKSRSISQRDLLKVRRVLFEPVDHESNEKFVKKELQKQMTFNSRKWNFDFEKGEMIDPKGVYVWKAEVKAQQVSLKRKHTDDYDNSDLYFNASTMCTKRKDTPEKSEEKQSKSAPGMQRLMTDYLSVRKHSTPDSKKKVKPVPIKKPRLTAS